MKTIFYSKEAQFELNDDEFTAFIGQLKTKKRVWIPRLNAFLSDMFIWAGDKPNDPNRRLLHDGTYVVNKFGTWVDAKDETIKIDMKFYPELIKNENVKHLRFIDKEALKVFHKKN